MKRLVLLCCLLVLQVSYLVAQEIINPRDAGSYLGKEVIMIGKIKSIEAPESLSVTKCTIAIDASEKGFLILIPKSVVVNSSVSFWASGKIIMVDGFVKYDKELYLEAKNISGQKKITKVVLSPPPGAHYWGENVTLVNIADISKRTADTVKTSGNIFGYKVLAKSCILYLGAAYPNQKLTVVLKGDARKYLAAYLDVRGHSEDGSKYLQGKTLAVIGVVAIVKGKPEILIKNPNRFIVDDTSAD